MRKRVKEWISQIRNLTKTLKQDNLYVTDRLIFSLIKKHASPLIYQEDGKMKIMKMDFLFNTLPFVELVEVNKIEAECTGIKSDCVIKRTKDKLPSVLTGYWGPIIRDVSSLDGEIEIYPTSPRTYVRKKNSSNAKYDKNKYYWFLNGFLYFPDLEWDAVKIDALFEGDISKYKCSDSKPCDDAQEAELGIPDYLISTIQNLVLQDLSMHMQIPLDQNHDKNSITR